MATIVCFHAHPDDESIATGGTMAKAADEGHTVVLVVATKGEEGEVDDGVLAEDELLGDRRVRETEGSAKVLGVSRVEFLGYRDSGMMGEPTNDNPDCFWQADVDEAAERLGAILRDVDADVLTIYDKIGGYGHPDHIQVHRVGIRAAEQLPELAVYEATMNRDHFIRLTQAARDAGMSFGEEGNEPPDFDENFGSSEDEITTTVDARDYVGRKRESMLEHASQITEASFFLQLPLDVFRESFGWEWFIKRGAPAGLKEESIC